MHVYDSMTFGTHNNTQRRVRKWEVVWECGPRSDKSESIMGSGMVMEPIADPTLDERDVLMSSLMIDLSSTPELEGEAKIVVLGRH